MSDTAVETRSFELAQHFLATGQPRRALDALEGANPDDLRTWRLRTAALHGQERWRETVKSARAGLELEPEDTHLLFYLAVAERLSGSLARAKKAVKRGVRISPHDPDLLLEQARIQTGYGLWDDAERSLSRAEAVIGPESIQVLLARADVAWGRHEHYEVERVVSRILALDPENPIAHAMLGDLQAAGYNFTTAFRHYENAARLAPEDKLIVGNARELRVARNPLVRVAYGLSNDILFRVLVFFGILGLWNEPLAGAVILGATALLFAYIALVPILVRAWYDRRSP